MGPGTTPPERPRERRPASAAAEIRRGAAPGDRQAVGAETLDGRLTGGRRRCAGRCPDPGRLPCAHMTSDPDFVRSRSLWLDTLTDDPLVARPPLAGDTFVDVVIIGAGFTGLWTALYLAEADPALRIAVIERDVAGFGASGRNGGWCSALLPMSLDRVAARHGRSSAIAMQREMHHTVDEVLAAAARHGIRCDAAKGGYLRAATAVPHLDRLPGRHRRRQVVGVRRGGRPAARSRRGRRPYLGGRHPRGLRTRPIAPRSTRRSWCAASPTPSNGQASPSTRAPRRRRSSRTGSARRTARSPLTSSCGRRRASRRSSPTAAGTSSRSTR